MDDILIECACGCGNKIKPTDKWGRPRKFISGHNTVKKYEDPGQFKREWNHRNRKHRQAYKKTYHRKRKIKLLEYKGAKCEECGISYNGKNASIFHFHHVIGEKSFNIGNQVINKAWSTLIEEVDKCIVLCANCHEMKHSAEF